nr:MAG TPA: hypothetical protein [Caudoviricetes sp.]
MISDPDVSDFLLFHSKVVFSLLSLCSPLSYFFDFCLFLLYILCFMCCSPILNLQGTGIPE